jgi:aminopeptidase N
MLRCLLGDNDFKKSLKSYFDLFKHKVAETEDLRKIFEQNSGIALERFFDQWIYQAGHPDLKATFSSNNNSINIKIEQVQLSYEFEFSLEIRIVLQVDIDREKTIDDTLLIAGKEIQKTYNINPGAVVKRFVIDPNFKILKKLSLVIEGANNSILINSLLNGETIVERIYAARALKDKQSDDLVDPLKKTILLHEVYWGVSVEAAKTLGTIKSDASYQALKECVNAIGNSRIKESVIKALGSFSKADSFDLLKRILENDHEGAIVQRAAATAIAESENEERTLPILIRLMEQKSYKDNVARGAIEGLKRIAMKADKKEKIESLLIQKTNMGNEARLRQAATSALGYVARYHNERTNIVSHLKGLLNDRSIHVRNTAFASLANTFEYSKDQQIIQELKQKIKEEDNDFVIETAERSVSLINENRPTSLFLTSEKSLLRDREYKLREIEDMEKCIVLY